MQLEHCIAAGVTYFPIKSSRPQQRGVESVGSVGGHDHLDLTESIKAIHLIQQLEIYTPVSW